jgi:hypothetical protein
MAAHVEVRTAHAARFQPDALRERGRRTGAQLRPPLLLDALQGRNLVVDDAPSAVFDALAACKDYRASRTVSKNARVSA